MSEIRNRIEIRVLGLMRSGNHAIISWICGLYPDQKICFLNNVQHGDKDPYETCVQRELIGISDELDNEAIRNTKKDVLVYSYEDKKSLEESRIDLISSVFSDAFEKNRENYLGKSESRFDIIIIRDPFNCFASRFNLLLRERNGMGGCKNMQVIKDNWKATAKMVLQALRQEEPNRIVINYNKWIGERLYQEDVARRLMGKPSFKSLDDISTYGGGSSFEPSRLTIRDLFLKWDRFASIKRWANFDDYYKRLVLSKKKRTPDDFLSRWKMVSGEKDFCELFTDREIYDLSVAIFGEIPGTYEFVKGIYSKYSSID